MGDSGNKTSMEVGTYACPTSGVRTPLVEPASLASLEWPVTVERCPSCGRRHVLQYQDVRHPPTFGYE